MRERPLRSLALLAALMLATACAAGPSARYDLQAMQNRLDSRGIGFGVTRVPGHEAFAFQLRFSTSEAGEETITDPMAAAQAAAPEGCAVKSVTPQEDGLTYHVEYQC